MLLIFDRVILSGHFEGDSPINAQKKFIRHLQSVVLLEKFIFMNAFVVLVTETLFVLQHYTTF